MTLQPYRETINRLPPPVLASLKAVIEANLGDIFPALVLAVIHHGDWMLNAAWGWIDPDSRQHPVTVDSLFDLASVTKLFVSTAFLSLVSEGKITLDAPLVSVIPEFGVVNPRPIDGGQDPHTKAYLPTPELLQGQTADPTQVTFRHLLTHTSGLAPWRDVYRTAGPTPAAPDQPEPVSRDERWNNALKALCSYPFVGQPDGVVRYSDLGLMLLGEAAARLSGLPLDEAVQERVLSPLELNSVRYNPVRAGVSREMIPPTEFDPSWRKRRCWGEVHDENACGVGGVAGHAGLFAPAREVALLGQAWLEGDTRLNLSPEIRSTAIQEQAETDGERRGLGWMLKSYVGSSAGDRFSPSSYGHTGFTGTSLWIEPERRLVVACLTNRVYPGREKEGIQAFRRAVHTILADLD